MSHRDEPASVRLAPGDRRLSGVAPGARKVEDKVDRQSLILEAVLQILIRDGIAGVSMRAVAKEAGVALGLVSYHFADKATLIAAVLRRVEDQDLAIVQADPLLAPRDRLRAALRRVADPEFLTTGYLTLRLQLWALAQVDEEFAAINATAQQKYRAGLSDLIRAARPELPLAECRRRAADIDIIQNGLWLTALLGIDKASIRRSIQRTEDIAIAD